MKNVRFYLEFPSKKDKYYSGKEHIGHTGNCIAVLLDTPAHPGFYGAYSSVTTTPNNDVNYGEVSIDYLREVCKRVPEDVARDIHPNLFRRLEDEN